jgi:hypothetical protein
MLKRKEVKGETEKARRHHRNAKEISRQREKEKKAFLW